MAGLGLVSALNQYQQGVDWKQQQQEVERAKQQRSYLDEANAAATGVINASQQEWAANGAQGQYRPNSTTMFKAAEARSAALAKRGLWDQFVQNEAQVAPMRIKTRADALQRYEQDGDIETLARTVYPTIFDGKEIQGVEKIEGAPGSDNLGLKAIPTKLKLKLSDGSTQDMEPQRLVQIVKSSLVDPQVTAKNEIMLNLQRAQQEIKTEGQIKVEEFKGEQGRKTKNVEHANKVEELGLNFGYNKQLHADNNASRERVGAGHDKATLGAAKITADSRKAVADKRIDGAVRAKGLNANSVQSRTTLSDGRVLLTMKDGTNKVAVDDSGKPYTALEFEKVVTGLSKVVKDSVGSYGLTPQQQRDKAKEMLPQQPTGQTGAKDYSGLWTQ